MNNSPPPTEAATFERAFRLSNLAMHSVALQVRRLNSTEPEDEKFLFRKWSDFDFLVVSLVRLRRSIMLASKLLLVSAALKQAVSEFDLKLPGLKLVRDVAEHVDDYAIERGYNKSVSRFSLEVSSLSVQNPTLHWLGTDLSADSALKAAETLFEAMLTAKSAIETNT